tara:strand:+ start:33 stop:350 length:318 start_codon:yes stop_codon:yes gene_type:complete
MAQENTISLNYGDNQDMRAFIDAMAPSVGGSISINVTIGVQEYNENRLMGVITNVDRDPYSDYMETPAAEEFTGMTEESVPEFDASELSEDLLLSEDNYDEEEEM